MRANQHKISRLAGMLLLLITTAAAGSETCPAPSVPSGPLPANSATDVPINADLSWSDSVLLHTFGAPVTPFSGSQQLRGNVYTFTQNVTLAEIRMGLNFSGTVDLYFYVLESTALDGSYVPIHETKVTTSGAGQGLYSSGRINESVGPGKFYAIGAAWGNQTVTHYESASALPSTWLLGRTEKIVIANDVSVPISGPITPRTSSEGSVFHATKWMELGFANQGSCAATFNVHLGTNPNPPLVATGLASPAYDPGNLASVTTYYWQVQAVNDSGTVPGPLWSFTTEAAPITVSGRILAADGTGIVGATMNINNGGGAAITDTNGFFSRELPYGWSGTATPDYPCHLFNPPFRTYSSVVANETDEDFTAAYTGTNGAIFVVNNLSDSGSGSLRQAMLDANAACGGNIVLSNVAGTIVLLSPLPTFTANLNLLGPGTNVLTISGGDQFRVFAMNARTTNSLSGLTIANGRTQGGYPLDDPFGSEISNAGSLKLLECIVRSCTNYLRFGAGIYNIGDLEMDGCVVEDCGTPLSDLRGGGIYNGGTLRTRGCVISRCRSGVTHGLGGAGIYNIGTLVAITTVIDSCQAAVETDGGGIANGGQATLDSCVVTNCRASWYGGGIYSWAGTLTMTNTSLLSNRVGDGDAEGGAAKVSGTAVFSGCTISGNSSKLAGSVFNGGDLRMYNCTLSRNDSISGVSAIADTNR